MAKKKQSIQECYHPRMIKQVLALIELLPLNRAGGLHFGKISRALGVSARTVRKWRSPGPGFYKRDFAKVIERAARKKFKELEG